MIDKALFWVCGLFELNTVPLLNFRVPYQGVCHLNILSNCANQLQNLSVAGFIVCFIETIILCRIN